MTAKIRQLSSQTINQIAAGEVVENPASVVKELVENAVDAGATKIVVEVKGGGYLLIRVSDDGVGMNREDALLSLERHATSKIEQVDDLLRLTTMGFRGEALASIAAISQMTLTTAEEQKTAVCLEIEGGKILSETPAARTRGTTIEVRSLFFNVPARKKFQKSAAQSTAEIHRMVIQLSLAHPDVEMTLSHGDEVMLSTSQGFGMGKVKEVLGEGFSSALRKVEWSEGGYRLTGLIGDPNESRHNRSGQYLFVNNRPVNCPAISYSVRDGYGMMLPENKHPVFILYVTLPPDRIDVNVHPQKKEIRLREEKWVREKVQDVIRKGFYKVEPIALSSHPAAPFTFFSDSPFPPIQYREQSPQVFKEEQLFSLPAKPIGLFLHYLLLDDASGDLLLVDLPAAVARVTYESLLKQKDSKDRSHGFGTGSQGLIIPLTLNLPPAEAQVIRVHIAEMEEIGLSIRPLGRDSFIIDAIPPQMEVEEVEEVVREIATELPRYTDAKEKLKQCALIASRLARSRKKTFSLEEGMRLYQTLLKTDVPYHCPHGNLIMTHMSPHEIERKFKS